MTKTILVVSNRILNYKKRMLPLQTDILNAANGFFYLELHLYICKKYKSDRKNKQGNLSITIKLVKL